MSFSRTKFTLREVSKIFDITTQQRESRTKNPNFWTIVLKSGHFPGRSVHSVNAQWQKFSLYETKELAIKKGLQLEMPYCVSFAKIPNSKKAVEDIKLKIFEDITIQ